MAKEDTQKVNSEKLKALQLTMDKIEKSYGKGSIMRMGDKPVDDVQAIHSGSIALDMAMGIGGYPKGRVIEIFGPESSGKTTLAIHAIAEAQKVGGIAAFIDAEHAFDPTYAQKLGVNINELLISQPDNGEQALEIADSLIRSGAIDIIVIDSVAALTPKAEIEGEMGESKMGLQARLMSQALHHHPLQAPDRGRAPSRHGLWPAHRGPRARPGTLGTLAAPARPAAAPGLPCELLRGRADPIPCCSASRYSQQRPS